MKGVPAAKTILLVDDDEPIRRLVRHTLGGTRCRFLEAADGRAGLRLARSERPDIVLLDVAMPELDGLTVARALREDLQTRDLPILLLTGTDAERVQRAAPVASACLKKPFRPLRLIQEVEKLIGKI